VGVGVKAICARYDLKVVSAPGWLMMTDSFTKYIQRVSNGSNGDDEQKKVSARAELIVHVEDFPVPDSSSNKLSLQS
jgi:hypothetical protein